MGRVILEGLGVDLGELRHELDEHISRYLPALEEDAVLEVIQSPAVERALERALRHMQSAGRAAPRSAICWRPCSRRKTASPFIFCARQGISRLDILEFISHDLPQILHERNLEADISRVGEAGAAGQRRKPGRRRTAARLRRWRNIPAIWWSWPGRAALIPWWGVSMRFPA